MFTKIHFEKGDLVKIKMTDHIYFEQIGQVEAVLRNSNSADAVLVNINDRFHDWFAGFEENLKKIEISSEKS